MYTPQRRCELCATARPREWGRDAASPIAQASGCAPGCVNATGIGARPPAPQAQADLPPRLQSEPRMQWCSTTTSAPRRLACLVPATRRRSVLFIAALSPQTLVGTTDTACPLAEADGPPAAQRRGQTCSTTCSAFPQILHANDSRLPAAARVCCSKQPAKRPAARRGGCGTRGGAAQLGLNHGWAQVHLPPPCHQPWPVWTSNRRPWGLSAERSWVPPATPPPQRREHGRPGHKAQQRAGSPLPAHH